MRTGALIGYARVSATGQLLDRQQRACRVAVVLAENRAEMAGVGTGLEAAARRSEQNRWVFPGWRVRTSL